jgi:hypothetical protein
VISSLLVVDDVPSSPPPRALISRWAAVRTQISQAPCARYLLILGQAPKLQNWIEIQLWFGSCSSFCMNRRQSTVQIIDGERQCDQTEEQKHEIISPGLDVAAYQR